MIRLPLVFLLLSATSVFSFPSKPLNERSTELAWQAWLLVDDQNQNKNNDSHGFLRRRITPKSVFIAPTFSPESLPDCPEGYKSDSMNRCIKIIKLDEDAHLDFLLQKLNEKFGDEDYEDESTEELPTPGPSHFNIPLNQDSKDTGNDEGSADIAIVVAPTSNGHFEKTDSSSADSTKISDSPSNTINVQTIAHILGVRQEGIETTTLPDASTDITASTIESTETSTLPTTLSHESTAFEGNALFFLTSESKYSQFSDSDVEDVSSKEESTTMMSTTPYIPAESMFPTDATTVVDNQNQDTTSSRQKVEGLVAFPHDVDSQVGLGDFVRFPGGADSKQNHKIRDTAQQSSQQIQTVINSHPELGDFRHDDIIFPESPKHILPLSSKGSSKRRRLSRLDHPFNERKPERQNDIFTFSPANAGDFSSHKPIVLKFSRKHGYLDMDNLKNAEFFTRQVPSGDLSHIFRFASEHFIHR